MALRRVKKRDGREVPFDESKIAGAVGKALAASGHEDPIFAAEVAGVVRMALEERHPVAAVEGAEPSVPDIEEIQDLVEQALVELGQAPAAKAYILYRDRRARIREALSVHRSPAVRLGPRAAVHVQVQEQGGASPWSKGRIVAALMGEADLARELAETVAARVESRVFASGLRRVTTGLVRELVDNELVSLGLAEALRRQAPVSIPVHDLRRLLEGGEEPLDGGRAAEPERLFERAVEARVASEVLRRFALSEVLASPVLERHLAGDLHVLELARPQRMLFAALPAELCMRGAPTAASAFDLLDELARHAAATAYGALLEDPGAVIQPLAQGGKLLGAWLRALTATARAAGRRIDLGPCGARYAALGARLVDELAELEEGPYAPRLFACDEELERWAGGSADATIGRDAAIERMLASGRLVPVWHGAGERFAAPGCHRLHGERAALYCGGAVALNLPRLALRAGPWREDRVLESLAELCADAVAALAQLSAFQQRTRAARQGEARGRVGYAIVPVGLREALALIGDGEVRPEQGARLLGLALDASRRHAQRAHLSVVLSPSFGERARARFAELDERSPQHAQRLLFDEGVGAAIAPGEPYGAGYRLSPIPGWVPWAAEAELCSTVPAGALEPLPEERSRGERCSLAESWRRFARLREHPLPAPSGTPRAAPQARLFAEAGPIEEDAGARAPAGELELAP
jgi:hypothetical protein